MQDQLKGRDIFLEKLQADENEQTKCRDGHHAKKMFAEWGAFYIEGEDPPSGVDPYDPNSKITPIPKDVEFRFYRAGDKDRKEREKTVVLILDPNGIEKLQEVRTWRCTYTPYEN